jgi:mycothiol synthase
MRSARVTIEHDSTGVVLVAESDPGHVGELIDELTAHVRAASGEVSVWIDRPDPATESSLAGLGLLPSRDLLQMEVPLPLPHDVDVTTRSFGVDRDEAEWVRVNNRAFSWHREQSGWTVERIRELEAEDWFDADGFRIHEIGGRMAGFCWTKVHPDVDPPAGEIYVIAVDPDFVGIGLGKAMTLAGLKWLHHAGLTVGMLYVDADNAPAVGLYERLGFTVSRVRRLYLPADISGPQ